MASEKMIKIADGFWNIRGVFRLFGLINVGTQASLVRLASGRFVLLDSYTLPEPIAEEVLALTDGGAAIDAVINLHPFHTVHVEAIAARFPSAKLYGTERHHARFPGLRWEPERTESEAFAALFADDLDFMVPRGVHFIPSDERLHFASVLAFHRASQTLHVDDTLNWMPLPWGGRLAFHMTLKSVLEDRPEAAAEFRAWAEALIARCEDVRHICTAHAGLAPLSAAPPGAIAARVREALAREEKMLRAHEGRA
ncbi:MAG: hypothetical protein KC486_25460 [Myxococcales bacterium]|nr:hypothetical protein [Myxococcales bacterium]